MPKFRIELDGPATGSIVQDGTAVFDIARLEIVLDAPTGQNFMAVAKAVPGGIFNTALDITKATLLIETREEG